MAIYNLLDKKEYIKEYVEVCFKEWGTYSTEEEYKVKINKKIDKIINRNDNIYVTLIIINDNDLVGFISLFKTDGEEYNYLTPWYATMYVKEKYRGLGYSKVLNNAILKEAKKLGFNKVYLKSNLINYYEKFGAIYINNLKNGEKLYYIDLF